MSYYFSLMKDVIIKAVVCYSKTCKRPSVFPQHLVITGSVCKSQTASDR